MSIERFDTVVIGAGQAGLALGYYLKKQGRDFVIFDASDRVGASWRKRWDSLRLFTPAHLDSLPGLPFPAPNGYGDCPTKDDMADYLAVIDFDDLAGLQAYLRHPAHEELGSKFGQLLSAAMVYDFQAGPLDAPGARGFLQAE